MTSTLDTLLQRVDDAIADWDASPHSWTPGDPLYSRPTCTESCGDRYDACTEACDELPTCEHDCGHQEVRPMLEEFPVDEHLGLGVSLAWLIECFECDVAWRPDVDGPTCWVCGDNVVARMSAAVKAVTDALSEWTNELAAQMKVEGWQERWLAELHGSASTTPANGESERSFLNRLVRRR